MSSTITQVKENSFTSIMSGVLLISGTSIGAGMLAFPVVTGVAGFYPAMFINTVCWLYMMFTGLLLLEVTLWMKDGSNILSMAKHFLGPIGKIVGGISFLFLYYCLLISYVSGGTPPFATFIHHVFGITLTGIPAYLLFTVLFGILVFLGTKVVDRVNWILMVGLVVSYFLLVGIGSTNVQTVLLERQNWNFWLLGAPVLFSAYGYHNIIPTMSTYLKRNVKVLRFSIILGTTLSFVVYSIWQWMIIGSLSEQQLAQAATDGMPITQVLQNMTGHPWVSSIGAYFGFFALVTSFISVALSMVDFVGDGLKVSRQGLSRIGLCALVLIPPMVVAINRPGFFLEALGYAGGYGEAILNGLIPIAMVWVGRYFMKMEGDMQLPGGKWLLIGLLLFTSLIIGLELQHTFA